jgi:hypothetical protein
MALSGREKRLATIVGVLAGLMATWLLVAGVRTAFQSRQKQLAALRLDVQKKRLAVSRSALVVDRFAEWEKRSLPRDRDIARSSYQNWLVATLDDARLGKVQVEPGRMTPVKDVYVKLPYQVRAEGTLEQTMRWLTEFYQADHLHAVRDLSLQPARDGRTLQIAAFVEAVILPETARRDKLVETTGARLSKAEADAAVAAVTKRNFFAAYVPPPPPRQPEPVVEAPPPPPKFDESKHTVLTSIISVDSVPEAWLNVRPTQQLLKLHEGDGIEVGAFKGKLVRIGEKEIEIDREGKRVVIALGTPLTPSEKSGG